MDDKLLSRPELTALLGISRTTFQLYKLHYSDFPAPAGRRAQIPLYSLKEVGAFYMQYAPQLLAKNAAGLKLAQELLKTPTK